MQEYKIQTQEAIQCSQPNSRSWVTYLKTVVCNALYFSTCSKGGAVEWRQSNRRCGNKQRGQVARNEEETLLIINPKMDSHTRRNHVFQWRIFCDIHLFLCLCLKLQPTSWSYIWCHCWHKNRWTSQKMHHEKHGFLLVPNQPTIDAYYIFQSSTRSMVEKGVLFSFSSDPWLLFA